MILQQITALKPNYMSTFDLYKGYYNVLLSKDSQKLTSFVNPKTGISYCHVTLPFGLNGSAGAFLYMMSRVFKDKTRWLFLFSYVDDLCLASTTFDEHVNHLSAMLQTLHANNLVLNPTKSCLAYSRIEYLGYIIDKSGVRIGDSKVKAISMIAPPKNKKSLQRLLGLLQYFKRYVSNFSRRTFNMRKLLKLDTKFVWNKQCDAELEDLKSTLISDPVLRPLQTDRPVYLTVDGSTLGIGSHLWQLDDDGIPHTCAYLSVATTNSQVKWASHQLELFGLAMSLRAYESLLLHQIINVYTDNAIVMQLSKYRPMNAREKRLVAYLSQFRLNIKYVKGTHNRVADYLSRLPEDLSTEQVQKLRPSHNLMNEEFILSLSNNCKTQSPMLSNERGAKAFGGAGA